jgi:hypothetical protein
MTKTRTRTLQEKGRHAGFCEMFFLTLSDITYGFQLGLLMGTR